MWHDQAAISDAHCSTGGLRAYHLSARPTPKGTIAKLTSTDVFDINIQPNEYLTSEQNTKKRPTVLPMKTDAKRPTGGQQAANKRPLTNNDKNERKKENQERVNTSKGNTLAPAEPRTAPYSSDSFSGEKVLLDSLTRMLESTEMHQHGGIWRMRIRSGPDHRKALKNALEDFNVRTPAQQAKINNHGAC